MKKCLLNSLIVFMLCIIIGGYVFAEGDLLPETDYKLPITEDKITLDVTINKNARRTTPFDETPLIRELQEKTNIDLNFESVPQSMWQEKVGIKLSTGSLPDVIWGGLSRDKLLSYAQQGMIIPLEGIIEEHCPNISKIFRERPDIKKALTAPDGHIYGLPQFNENPELMVKEKTYINKKWLDNLGLEVPETTEEYFEVLKAFKEKDPNGNGKQDEIPLTFKIDGWAMGLNHMFGPFGVSFSYGNEYAMVEDGKVLFAPMTEGYKEGIKYFHSLYEAGVLDMEAFTQNRNQYISKIKTDPYKVGSFVAYLPGNFAGDRWKENYVYLSLLKGPDGIQMYPINPRIPAPGHFVITSENEHPVETLKLIDYIHSSLEMQLTVRSGPRGESWDVNEEGKWVAKREELEAKGISMSDYINNNAFGQVAEIFYTADRIQSSKILSEDEAWRGKWTKNIIDNYAPEEVYIQTFVDPELKDEANLIQSAIYDYVEQMMAKWILKGGVDEDWDNYIKKLKAMDVERLIEIKQTFYDTYKNN